MLQFIIINIAVVFIILGLDLYRQKFTQLKFSSILIAITINSFINLFFAEKQDYITICTVAQLLIWTILHIYIDKTIHSATINKHKYMAFIISIIFSLSLLLIYGTSQDSYYMSAPYFSPTIFMLGFIILLYSTFKPEEKQYFKLINRIKAPLYVGHTLIIISFTVMIILTPYWYILLFNHIIFLLYIYWQKLFSKKY